MGKIFSTLWSVQYDKEKLKFDVDKEALRSGTPILYPGRFYVLNHRPKDTKKITNTRPVILSLGPSKKDKDVYLCLDLCILPKSVRFKFIEIFFDLFKKEIQPNLDYWEVKDADKQSFIKNLSYQNLLKIGDFRILQFAIKKYNIKDIQKIYSLLYCDVYKVIGNFADENYYINDTISNIQKGFLDKIKTMKK